MPNMPDPNKVVVSAQVTRETHRRLKKIAEAAGRSISATASSVLRDALENVQLSAEDFLEIAREIQEAKAGRRAK